MIKVKKASYKRTHSIMGEMTTVSTVLEQNGIYFNPKDNSFLYSVFKEYSMKYLKTNEITLNLSSKDIYFYAKNANIYLLNYIYKDLFPDKKELKPYETIITCAEDGDINLPLFSVDDSQIIYFVEMLEEMKIDFERLRNVHLIKEFPASIEMCKYDKIENVTYSTITDNRITIG